jgi:hypothetical protein
MSVMFDFSGPGRDRAIAAWEAIGDRVMGGTSVGRLCERDGCAAFDGLVSPDRGGGFASIRSSWAPRDLSRFHGIEIEVRGDGHTFSLNLRDETRFDAILHRVSFAPRATNWQVLRFPFGTLRATFRGRPVRTGPLRTDHVTGIGLMISDRQYGPFDMAIRRISAYRESDGSPPSGTNAD